MTETTNILLVDDEPGMLRYIRTLLEVDDYKVETAATGEEALQRVEKGLDPDMKVPLTHEEIGQMIGTSRETVTRLMAGFRKQRFIETEGATLVVSNRVALENLITA